MERTDRSDLQIAAERLGLPVGCAFRFQDYFDNRHPCYAGHIGIGPDPALAKAITESDLVIAIGARLGEATTGGYTLLEPPVPKQPLIHVHPDPDELGKVYRPTLGIAASPQTFTAALAKLTPTGADKRAKWVKKLNDGYKKFSEPETTPGAVKLEQVARIMDDVLPENAIVTNGAGNCNGFFNRYYVYKTWRSQLAPSCGADGLWAPGGNRGQAASAGAAGRGDCRRRLLHDERAGTRHRLSVRREHRRHSSSTTACMAPSACIRSASTRGASWRRASSIRISRHSPAATARTARRSRRPGNSARR